MIGVLPYHNAAVYLRVLMDERGQSYQELARLIGVSNQQAWKLQAGVDPISPLQARRLVHAGYGSFDEWLSYAQIELERKWKQKWRELDAKDPNRGIVMSLALTLTDERLKDILLTDAVNKIRNLGYTNCTAENIVTDRLFRRMYISILQLDLYHAQPGGQLHRVISEMCEVVRKINHDS